MYVLNLEVKASKTQFAGQERNDCPEIVPTSRLEHGTLSRQNNKQQQAHERYLSGGAFVRKQ